MGVFISCEHFLESTTDCKKYGTWLAVMVVCILALSVVSYAGHGGLSPVFRREMRRLPIPLSLSLSPHLSLSLSLCLSLPFSLPRPR